MKTVALGVAAVASIVVAHAPPSLGGTAERSYYSPALRGTMRVAVSVPPGYADSTTRYPVVYFLHGLPASPTAYRNVGVLANALGSLDRQAIVVVPQGARDGDSDPEYLDWGTGRNWETAVARELPRFVDSHYRTIATRRGRALVGVSAGGYGAVLLALHNLRDFSVVESWSGYFHPTDPSGTKTLDIGTPEENAQASAHTFVSTLRREFAAHPTFLAFYVGRNDERFRDENLELARELTAARVPHLFRLYRGAHEPSVWNEHARAWLALALDHLAVPHA